MTRPSATPSPHRAPPIPGLPALTLALGVTLGAAACGGDVRSGDPSLQVRVTVDPPAPLVGTARIRVEVADADWTPRNGARVVLTGVREGVTLAADTAWGEGAGRYVAPAFRFEVTGEWVLLTRVELPDGRWHEVERKVTVGGDG